MSLYGSPGLDRPGSARRSIRFTFAATVAAPVVCMILLWGLVVSALLAGLLTSHGFSARYHRALAELTGIVGASLVVVLVSALLMGAFARRVSREVSALEATAKYLSDDQLNQLVRQLRQGKRAALPGEGPLRPLMRIAEISRAAQAIARLQHTAATATVGEARLREGIGDVFVSLARRNQSLLQKQLRLIDELEQKAANPAALADLFPLDHLTTRMRRQAESLIILAGATPGRSWSEPVPVVDVIRAAVAEIEDYQRVVVRAPGEDAVAGAAAADMIHLLAELIENAAVFSPPRTQVEVRAERVVNGVAIEVDDRGLGIKPTQLGVINQQLAHPPDFDLANADQLGIFVVGKLAARHQVRVTLRPSPYGGTTAVVLLPTGIVVPAPGNGQRRKAGSAPALPIRRRGTSALPLSPPAAPPVSSSASAFPLPGASSPAATPGRDAVPGMPTPSEVPLASGVVPSDVPPCGVAPSDVPPAPGSGTAFGMPASGEVPLASGDVPPDVPPSIEVPSDGRQSPPPAAPGTYRGLPRRVRQASLSPHLRNGAGNAAAGPAGDAAGGPAGNAAAGPAGNAAGGPAGTGSAAAGPAGTTGSAVAGVAGSGNEAATAHGGVVAGLNAGPVGTSAAGGPPAQTAPASARRADLTRDPAEARALVAAMQNGWRRGRATDPATTEPLTATAPAQPGNQPPAGQPSTETPGARPGSETPGARPSSETPEAQLNPGPAAPPSTSAPSSIPAAHRTTTPHRTTVPLAQQDSDRPGSEVEP